LHVPAVAGFVATQALVTLAVAPVQSVQVTVRVCMPAAEHADQEPSFHLKPQGPAVAGLAPARLAVQVASVMAPVAAPCPAARPQETARVLVPAAQADQRPTAQVQAQAEVDAGCGAVAEHSVRSVATVLMGASVAVPQETVRVRPPVLASHALKVPTAHSQSQR